MKKYLDFFTPRELIAVRRYLQIARYGNEISFSWLLPYVSEARARELSRVFTLRKDVGGELMVSMYNSVKDSIYNELFERAHCEGPKHIIAGVEFDTEDLKELCSRGSQGWNTWYEESCFSDDSHLSTGKMLELVECSLAERKVMDDGDVCYRLTTHWKPEFENYIRSNYLSEDLIEAFSDWNA